MSRIGYYTRRAFAYERQDKSRDAIADLKIALGFPQGIIPVDIPSAFDQRPSILLSLARNHQKLKELPAAIHYATLALSDDPKFEKCLMYVVFNFYTSFDNYVPS